MSGRGHRPAGPEDVDLAGLLALEEVLGDAHARLSACLRLLGDGDGADDGAVPPDAVAVPSAATAR